MSELAELRQRVTRLEKRMDDVHHLAKGADREVAGWRGVLNRHTDVLNSMSERLDDFRRSVDERFAEVDERFTQVDERFDKVDERFDKLEAKVNDGFTKLDVGQAQITALLKIAIDKSDET